MYKDTLLIRKQHVECTFLSFTAIIFLLLNKNVFPYEINVCFISKSNSYMIIFILMHFYELKKHPTKNNTQKIKTRTVFLQIIFFNTGIPIKHCVIFFLLR